MDSCTFVYTAKIKPHLGMLHTKKRTVLVLGAVGLLFGACQREYLNPDDLDITLRPGFVFPLGQADLTIGDVFKPDSSMISTDPNGLYRLVYSQPDLFDLQVGDIVEIPNQSPTNESFSMGVVNIPNVNFGSSVRFGKLVRNITNPPGTANLIKSAHGGNSYVPNLPVQNPGDLAGANITTFSTASFSGGQLSMKLVNKYPVPISSTMAITDVQGNELLTFVFTGLASQDSSVSVANLAGKTLPGNVRFKLKNFSSPGAGTLGIPSTYVPIDTNALLKVNVSGTGLQIWSATAQVQSQQVVDETLTVDFGAAQGVKLKELKLNAGSFDYSFNSALPETLQMLLEFSSATINGQTVSQTITVPPGQTTAGSIPLSNAVFNLASNPAQPYNQLPISYSASIVSSGNLVQLDSSSSLAMSFTMNGIQFGHLKGFFGQDTIEIAADSIQLAVDAINKLGGSISFAEPSISMNIDNSIGLPLTMELEMTSYTANNQASPLNAPALTLPFPTVAQLGQTVSGTLTIDKNNSNIVNLLTLPKETFSYGGRVLINADTVANGTSNFVTSTSGISGDLLLELPFYFRASGIGFTDSIDLADMNLGDLPVVVNGAKLHLGSVNSLPLGVTLVMNFFDSTGVLTHNENLTLLQSGTVDPATGLVTAPVQNTATLDLDAAAAEKVLGSTVCEIQAVMATSNNGTVPVKLLTTSALRILLGIEVDLEYTVN